MIWLLLIIPFAIFVAGALAIAAVFGTAVGLLWLLWKLERWAWTR